MKRQLAVFMYLALTSSSSLALEPWTDIDPKKGCKTNPAVVSACFEVHGRIFVANGGYPFRIWPVGTKRYLAVLPAEEPIAPANVLNNLSFDQDVFADLVVCPFTKQHPKAMQFVCIESAKNVWFKQ